MLYAFVPISFVNRSIRPIHFSIPHSFIVYIVSMVYISTLPSECSKPIFHIKLILSFKPVALRVVLFLSPVTSPMLHTVFEFSSIYASTFPFVHTFSLWLSMHINSRKRVSICKNIGSFSMFQTLIPASFESISILPLMNPVPMSFGI